jgi:uncharacterized lipoprotein YddW (UPF0748 family)
MGTLIHAAVYLLALSLAFASVAEPTPQGDPIPVAVAAGELRAYWADAFGEGMNSQAEIDQLVAATKAAHLNAIVAQVVRRGDCFCNRAAVPRTDAAISPLPFDPLDALIATAHANGIEVHAWVIANAMWQTPGVPTSPDHVYNRHGPTAVGRDNWVMSRADGLATLNRDIYLDPGHPDAAAWIVNVATSIVRAYDVDGINLDRIRYPDGNLGANVPSWGYNPTALDHFRADTGRTDTPAPADPQWAQWRRDQITNIVRRVYVESTALRPRLRVSADVITYGFGPQTIGTFEGTRAYAEVLQDWRGWLREGILDTAILMNYKRDTLATGGNDQRRMYLEWSDFAKDNQFRRSAAIGAGLYINDIASSARQARVAIAPSAAGNSGIGWAGYSYRTPDDLTDTGARSGAASRVELAKALTQPSAYDPTTPAVFAETRGVPGMSWKVNPLFGHLRGTVRAIDGTTVGGAKIALLDDATGFLVRSTVSDGGGWFGFVDLLPNTYRVTTDAPLVAGGLVGRATVVAGAVATVSAGAAPGPTPTTTPIPSPSATPTPPACQSSVGPGIPPPARVASGAAGFHASWYGQSGYPTLCPGERATAVVAYFNSGTRGWVAGKLGEVAYLGTWNPEPGQDRASVLGGDGGAGSPDTGWPRFNRVAVQPAEYVGPNQVAWFEFTIVAPNAPGTYRLAIRPLIEGAQWMEDYGVFWYVTVKG